MSPKCRGQVLPVPVRAPGFRWRATGFAIACALLAASAAPATAQERVQLDPDSPAGVEYQLPLDRARLEAAPSRGASRPSSGGDGGSGVPLFGAGIAPGGSQSSEALGEDRPADEGSAGGGQESEDAAAGGGGARGTGGPGEQGGSPSSLSTTTAGEGGGDSTGLILGAIALGVVAVGGGLGLALRRGLNTTPAS